MQNPDVDWGMYFKYRIGIFDERQKMPDTTKDFIGDGFDIVVTNPPYKNLKAEKAQYHDEVEFNNDKAKYEIIARQASEQFRFSTTGILNIYKLFVMWYFLLEYIFMISFFGGVALWQEQTSM